MKIFSSEDEPEVTMDPDTRRILVRQLLGPDAPPAWCELVEALAILAPAHNNDVRPLYCEDGMLTVCAQPAGVPIEEIDRLEQIGFEVAEDEETFYSFRFGTDGWTPTS
ncbi:hypothetical protein OWR29_35390 [Actinoplanes sp. Pm04-4]|uniref:Uncharacterized protein n=1 Tax=Paractinoplanes pyxinae TaxID=2997416 RepID=A0ABT4BCK0_9ACTN|nr:hypothetical protein [Actinoplanes pyxinae]MCY1143310.1 hypothetical protein [Actinoplanes pyxinae]